MAFGMKTVEEFQYRATANPKNSQKESNGCQFGCLPRIKQKRLKLEALKKAAGRITERVMGDTTYKSALFGLQAGTHGTIGRHTQDYVPVYRCETCYFNIFKKVLSKRETENIVKRLAHQI